MVHWLVSDELQNVFSGKLVSVLQKQVFNAVPEASINFEVYFFVICMKRSWVGCVLGLLIGYTPALGQSPQSWINFSQTYYKLSTAQDAIYRVTYNDLLAAGVPVNAIDPRVIQVFHRGSEQAILFQHAQTPPDGKFDSNEFFEFYGRRNDGTRDGALYKPATLQPHKLYNLFSDTTAFFLTWNLLPVQGKRMSTYSEVNTSALVAEPFQRSEAVQVQTSDYSGGVTVADVLQYTHFDQGEGWTGPIICVGNAGCTGFQDFTFTLPRLVTSATPPVLEVQLNGRDDLPHEVEILVGANSGSLRVAETVNFTDYETPTVTLPLLWSDIAATELVVRIKVNGVGGGRDRISASYLKVTYPQSFDIAGASEKSFSLAENAANRSYIELQNTPAGTRLWDITSPDEPILVGGQFTGGVQRYIVRNTAQVRKLWAASAFRTPVIRKVSFRPILPQQANYLVVSHAALRKPAGGFSDPVAAYAGFRASAAGGGYDTLTVNVDLLYNQFNYGEISPVAIYEFMKFMVAGQPKYLFLVGKGREVYEGFYRKTTVPTGELRCLVPPAGTPVADMAFTAGLLGTTFDPAVPTGRLSASTPQQVVNYLNKVREFETGNVGDAWRKRGLHLSGGTSQSELTQFRIFVDEFKRVAQDRFWGATVATISKRDPKPVEFINISRQVNDGINLVTFFGHSSSNATDIDIGFVTDPLLGYNNPGRYPVFLVNGCNAGSFFFGWNNFGEDWMLAPNRGARAFIAHSSFGFSGGLRGYSNLFYQIGFADSTFVGRGVGDVQREVARQYLQQFGTSLVNATQVQQMFLLGDPAVKLVGATKPDLCVTDQDVSLQSLDGRLVTAQSDSFAIRVIVRNTGLVRSDSVRIKVTRTSPTSQRVYLQKFPPIFNQDTLLVRLTNQSRQDAGSNQFLIDVDDNNRWSESDEANNRATFNALIPLNGTQNLYPINYAVVASGSVQLVWQNANLATDTERDYILEIDTTITFSSPFQIRRTVRGKVLLRSNLSLLAKDTVTYYWRTRLAVPTPDESSEWSLFSFTRIQSAASGWGQFSQAQKSEAELINLEPRANTVEFISRALDLQVNTYGGNYPFPPATSLKIDNLEYNTTRRPCRNNTLNLVAFNKTSLVPYLALDVNFFDPRVCGRESQVINSFTAAEMVSATGIDLVKYISNVALSDSVLLFTIGNADFSNWPAAAKNKLAELGITPAMWDMLDAGEPIAVLGRKGAAPGTARVFRAAAQPRAEQPLFVGAALTGKATTGKMVSSRIGPAARWGRARYQLGRLESVDATQVDVYGIAASGDRTKVAGGAANFFDLQAVSAAAYPFLQLEFQASDSINLSAAQLRYWMVDFEPVPEGLIAYRRFDPVTVQEGQPLAVTLGFTNISTTAFTDSLQVETTQRNTRNTFVRAQKIRGPAPGDTTFFAVPIVTRGQVGANSLSASVNPRIRPEQYYENNQIEFVDRIQVVRDRQSPVLDVTVDGRWPRHLDFVSPNPSIVLELRDENPFLLKEDTLGVNVFWKKPCAAANCPFERVALRGSTVEWSRQTTSQPYRIIFRPMGLTDGIHVFRFEVTDASGNLAGGQPYELQLQVKAEEGNVFVAPYPNPSAQGFTFQWQVSGVENPRAVRLQIRALDGRLVREFETTDFSRLTLGTNAFTWDATDPQGIPLRSGLFLYTWTVETATRVFTTQGKLSLIR